MNSFVPAIFGGLFSIVLFIGIFVLYVYIIVLFIKLARRGIKALDIYISKNNWPGPQGPDYYQNQQFDRNPNNSENRQ